MAFPAWSLVGKTSDSACSIGGCVPCANGIRVPLGFHPHALQRCVRVNFRPWRRPLLCSGPLALLCLELNRSSGGAASLVGWGLFLPPVVGGVVAGKS